MAMIKNKWMICILFFVVIGVVVVFTLIRSSIGVHRSEGFVPDEETAIKIAEAVWYPIYGDGIYNDQPFTAIRKRGYWVVEGNLPENMDGGVPVVHIRKSDGKILYVNHGK